MLYFDHASGALPDAETLDIIKECISRYPANQEAVHPLAYEARKAFEDARVRLARILTGTSDFRAVAFSGGTAAIAALSHWQRLRNKKVFTTRMEHPAVSACLRQAQAECRCFELDKNGVIKALSIPEGGCKAVFITHVHSETGTIQPVDEVFAKNSAGSVIKICDTIQSAAKIPLPRSADVMTVSGAKFGVPGAAALLVRKEFAKEIEDIALDLRRNYQVCRINIPMFVAMTEVIQKRMERQVSDLAYAKAIRELCCELAAERKINCTIAPEHSSPYICHLNFPQAEGAVIVRLLGAEGICVGSGTACSAETPEPSSAMLALGFSKKAAFGGLRISFNASTTACDIKKLFDVLEKVLKNY